MQKRKNKRLLGELYDFPDNTMAIGRLDDISEGLLLLTTDGQVSEQIRSKKIEKEYHVQVDGIITDQAIFKLRNGVEISLKGVKYLTLPCKSEKLVPNPIFENPPRKVRDERHGPTSWLSVTLTEGKFRQVRKMCAVVGFPVLRLVRIRIGNIHLDEMESGQVIKVDSLDV